MPWLKAEATYFHRDIKDMIKLVSSNRSLQYVNLGQIDVEGFELELKADLTDRLFVFANYTQQTLTNQQRYIDDNIATPNPAFGKDVPNIPKQLANLGVEHKTLGLFRDDALFKLFRETHWVDDYYYGWALSRYQDRKIDAQISHTAGFEYTFHNDEMIVGFEVRNLTDEAITDVFNYPLMGRTYHLNLRYTWLR